MTQDRRWLAAVIRESGKGTVPLPWARGPRAAPEKSTDDPGKEKRA